MTGRSARLAGPRRYGRVLAVLVLALASAAACLETKAPAPRIRVACVGDSITEGEGVEDPAERYPARLGALLGDAYEVRDFGASGSTMLGDGDRPYRTQKAYRKALDFRPDVVVVALQGRLELIPDRVHPNGEGARLIADAVHRALTRTRPAG